MGMFSFLIAVYLGAECLANFNQVYAYVNKREPWKFTKFSANLFNAWQPKLGAFYYVLMVALMLSYTFAMGVVEDFALFFMAMFYGITTIFAWFVLARKSAHALKQQHLNAIGPQGGIAPPPLPR